MQTRTSETKINTKFVEPYVGRSCWCCHVINHAGYILQTKLCFIHSLAIFIKDKRMSDKLTTASSRPIKRHITEIPRWCVMPDIKVMFVWVYTCIVSLYNLHLITRFSSSKILSSANYYDHPIVDEDEFSSSPFLSVWLAAENE